MKKKYFLICAAALAVAASVSFGAMTVNAQDEIVPETAAAVQADTAGADAVYIDYAHDNYEYDYYTTTATTGSTKKKSVNWLQVILISVGISAIVTGITVAIIYKGYKHNGMTEPYEYTKKAPLELTDKEDELVDVRVTSRKIERNR